MGSMISDGATSIAPLFSQSKGVLLVIDGDANFDERELTIVVTNFRDLSSECATIVGSLRGDGYFDDGYGGRKLGVDASARLAVKRTFELEGRLTGYQWRADLATDGAGTTNSGEDVWFDAAAGIHLPPQQRRLRLPLRAQPRVRARQFEDLPDLDVGQAHIEREEQARREVEILPVEPSCRVLGHHLAAIPCSSTASKTSA